MSKIIGVTVGTPTSPSKMAEELKPVKTVNGVSPDENGSVKITIRHDWNQNDPTAPDYIENRPFYEEMELEPVVAEQTVPINEWEGKCSCYVALGKPSFFNEYPGGTKCMAVINGKEYTGVIDADGYYFGNGAFYNDYYPNTGEDFVVWNDGVDMVSFWTRDMKSGDSCTVSVYVIKNTSLKKIDHKFLPDEVGGKKPYVIDSEAYTYGDDALAAILEGRQIFIKVPNKYGGTLYSNFMPVLQYQLPNENNNYLILFYLKDGIAENIMTAMQAAMQGNTAAFDGVFGAIEMMLSRSYSECPLKVSPIK